MWAGKKDTLGILVKNYYFNCGWRFESFYPKSTKLGIVDQVVVAINEKGSLWKSVINSIHNLMKKLATYIARKTSNGVWCYFHKVVITLGKVGVDSQHIFQLTPGLDVKILFWKDGWCGSTLFQQNFPNLYKFVKCCLLTDRLSSDGFSWRWTHIAPSTSLGLHESLQLYKNICPFTCYVYVNIFYEKKHNVVSPF